jgi:ketosteroid isomerase-like protein
MKWFAAIVCAAALASCTQAAAPPADPAAIVAERNAAFMAAVAASDGAGVGANYTEDAVLMPPGMPTVEGREAIGQFFQAGIDAGIARVELAPGETIATSADTILERSTVRVFNTAGDVIEQGKYVVVWRKVGDQWFMAWDIWNADAPPPAPAPATP